LWRRSCEVSYLSILEALCHGCWSGADPSALSCGDGLWSYRTPQRYHPGEACMALKDY